MKKRAVVDRVYAFESRQSRGGERKLATPFFARRSPDFAVARGRSLVPDRNFLRLDKVATGSYFRAMRSVGIKLLKNKLSEYIRLAAVGEIVLVTDRDRVVAELGPPAPGRSPLVSDALLLDAVRQGWIRPPLSAERKMPARKPVMKLGEILADLHEDRADR
jgi:antitoxin (DNA-binding transcriptional repressor) of toxin-antitoxin stability system